MNLDLAPAILKGRSPWLLSPLLWGNLVGGAIAGWYVLSTAHVELDEARRLLPFVVALIAVGQLVWLLQGGSRLRTIRYVGSGRVPPTRENLIAAIGEAQALPDWLRTSCMLLWAVECVAAAVLFTFVSDLDLGVRLRIVAVGVTLGPLSSVLVYLLAARRSRVMVQEVAQFVPTLDVLSALERQKGRSVRDRLAFFTAMVVLLPCALVVDATRAQSQQVLEHVSGVPRSDQAAVARAAARDAAARVLVLAAMLIAFAVWAAWLAGTGLAEPMRHIADEANRISRGDLRDVRVVPAEDEVWIVTSTFSLMQAQLSEVIGQLQRAGISIGTTTEQLMATSSKYESGAADQASSLNETSATTEELAQSARQIAHNASNVADLAQKTFDAARAGQDSAQAFVSAVERMKHDNHSIAEAVTRLQKRVQQIGRIVEFITTVADRSDLLALSAELEGTKAGDVGRGFTLVAAEMRRLAENVIESTNEIEELIGEIREATLGTVGATARGMEHTESGTALAGNVASALQQVVTLAQSTSDSVRAISLATQQQQSSTDQLAEAMADILGITQQSLAATKQVTSANHELITLSGDLKALVERFQVRS